MLADRSTDREMAVKLARESGNLDGTVKGKNPTSGLAKQQIRRSLAVAQGCADEAQRHLRNPGPGQVGSEAALFAARSVPDV